MAHNVDPAIPNFAQTRHENVPTNGGDLAVKAEDAEEAGEAPQAGGSITPQTTGTANPPIQSTKPRGQSDRMPAIQVDDDDDDDGRARNESNRAPWAKAVPKYVVRPGEWYSTGNLQKVSDAESRITSIKTKDKTGKIQRLYGKANIAGYGGVAIVGNGVVTSSLRAPTTYVKIKWKDIREEHAHLCRNGKNWTSRRPTWEIRKVRAPEAHRGPTVKREERPSVMPGPYPKEAIPLASGVQSSSHSLPPAAGSPTPGATEAVEASGSAAHSHGQDRSGNPDADEQKPKTFSERQYLENMKQDLGLESLRNEALGQYMEQMALVRAKFDVYRGEMERQGYVLVHRGGRRLISGHCWRWYRMSEPQVA
ncbi:hypothetical protein CBS147353_11498 [Aspergillus niger]|nr:hypothetical protein CBS147353_11498 [Aspergillus niger]